MTSSPLFSQRDIEAVRNAAEKMASAANEALQVANKSTSQSQRYARFNIVRVNLDGLKRLCAQYPFLSLTHLEAFEASFEKVQSETKLMTFTNTPDQREQKIRKLGPTDLFLKLSLAAQCDELQIELEVLSIDRIDRQWIFSGVSFSKPETAALAYYQNQGFVGTSCEGAAPLMIMKCSCLNYLKKVNIFGNPEDACTRYFEAQCQIYSHLSHYIIDHIERSTEALVLANFREITALPRCSAVYPPMNEEAIVAIWRAIGPHRLAALTKLFMEDPYRHRAGWPDLTLARGSELRFVEVKTSDRLHGSQKALIEEILRPWNASVGVLQITARSASGARLS